MVLFAIDPPVYLPRIRYRTWRPAGGRCAGGAGGGVDPFGESGGELGGGSVGALRARISQGIARE
jgi:hypothetical protein